MARRKRVNPYYSDDEITRKGVRTSRNVTAAEEEEFPFVRIAKAAVGVIFDAIQRIGSATIGPNFTGNARGEFALDIQAERATVTQVASGDSSIAIGNNNTASGINSVAIGGQNQALSNESVAMGYVALSMDDYAVAVGRYAGAWSPASVAIGDSVTASGTNAVAVGTGAECGADNSLAIGSSAQAYAAGAVAIGLQALANNPGDVVLAGQALYLQTAPGVQIPIPLTTVILQATEANILASTEDAGTLAYATDTYYLLLSLGAGVWKKSAFRLQAEVQAPNMGMGAPLSDPSRIGYGETWLSDKLISNVDIGSNAATANASATRIPMRAYNSTLQIYVGGAWQTIVSNFVFREDSLWGQTLEHAPVGFTYYLEVMSGSSLNNLGLNGLPIVNHYNVSMGAYPVPAISGGRTIA